MIWPGVHRKSVAISTCWCSKFTSHFCFCFPLRFGCSPLSDLSTERWELDSRSSRPITAAQRVARRSRLCFQRGVRSGVLRATRTILTCDVLFLTGPQIPRFRPVPCRRAQSHRPGQVALIAGLLRGWPPRRTQHQSISAWQAWQVWVPQRSQAGSEIYAQRHLPSDHTLLTLALVAGIGTSKHTPLPPWGPPASTQHPPSPRKPPGIHMYDA
jgi:hypothetical protein